MAWSTRHKTVFLFWMRVSTSIPHFQSVSEETLDIADNADFMKKKSLNKWIQTVNNIFKT